MATTRRSAAKARFTPAPTAAPRTAAMTGTSSSPTRTKDRYTMLKSEWCGSDSGSEPAPERVSRWAPAQK
jgi:hypothetical protein